MNIMSLNFPCVNVKHGATDYTILRKRNSLLKQANKGIND